MRRIIHILPILVVMAGIGIIVYYAHEDHNQKKARDEAAAQSIPIEAKAPESKHFSPKDWQLAQTVFGAPSSLDAQTNAIQSVVVDPNANLANRPALLSSKTQPVTQKDYSDLPQMQVPPPYVEDFMSLRTKAIRDPESAQNRKIRKDIATKRQKRIRQLDYSKINI